MAHTRADVRNEAREQIHREMQEEAGTWQMLTVSDPNPRNRGVLLYLPRDWDLFDPEDLHYTIADANDFNVLISDLRYVEPDVVVAVRGALDDIQFDRLCKATPDATDVHIVTPDARALREIHGGRLICGPECEVCRSDQQQALCDEPVSRVRG